jgi:tetratricopeptide (TPR) repeat protein
MAFYEGPTLKQRLERGPMAIEEALEVATQIADGLAKAHKDGVVHRDIKPGNVMLTEDGVRILDFGLATFVDALKLTAENSSFGTPTYMSPEQVRGQAADARSDVWATGVVLYEMLAGHPPFQGSHAEAIAHAIRHETPAPLRSIRPDVTEEVEQLVFRALHKDPSVRFQSGRELARAIRQVRGLSVPIELRTEPIVGVAPSRAPRARPRALSSVAAMVLAAALAGGSWWITRSIERVAVVVAPVSNQTGFDELQPFRLALTNLLTMHLSDSDSVRVIPYDRVLQALRRYLLDRTEVASRDAVEAVGVSSGARYVLVPTLLYADGVWRARVEIRVPSTGLNVHTFETAGVSSSIATDAAFAFMRHLATHVNEHLASPRARARRVLGLSSADAGQRAVRSLDAAKELEEGLNAYDRLEYASARRAFTAAAERDRRSPLIMAWLTRVDMLMRQDDKAGESAARTLGLVDAQTPRDDAVFSEAVAREARADYEGAERGYRELARRYPDEPAWLMELAAFHDRRTRNADAIATYHQALALDPRITRAHVELCRLYSPNRTNEPARAKTEGELALAGYRELGDRAGEAQALFCLVDVLRVGSPAERAQALSHANAASTILTAIDQPYNQARADNYIALIAGSGGDMPTAVKHWEQALTAAQATGNRVLAPRVMNNLGVAYQALGDRGRAVDFYRQSYDLNETLGDQQEAARTRANVGAILIEYGNIDEGLREVQRAQRVAEQLTDKTFEVLCLQLVAAYYRQTGRYDEAVRILSQAVNTATERNLASRVISSTIDLARVHIEMARYETARELLVKALADESGRESMRARSLLGLVYLRLGQPDAAETEFRTAMKDATRRGDLLPFLGLAMGELALQRGLTTRAREELQRASSQASAELTDPASIEAAALLDLTGPAASLTRIERCIDQAKGNGRLSLQARCRLYRARALVGQGRGQTALQELAQIPLASGFEPGPEIRAQIHYWRGEALMKSGTTGNSAAERDEARRIIGQVRQSLRPPDRDRFDARPDLRLYAHN